MCYCAWHFFPYISALSDVNHLSEVHYQAVVCVKHIVTQYFDKKYPISIRHIYNSNFTNSIRIFNIPKDRGMLITDIIVKELTYGMSWPGIVWYITKKNMKYLLKITTHDKPLQLILMISINNNDDLENSLIEVWSLLEFYNFQQNLGSSTKIILVLPKISKMFKTLFYQVIYDFFINNKVYNFVLLSPFSQFIRNQVKSKRKLHIGFEIYTWFPFENATQCGRFEGMTLLDEWNQNDSGKFEHGRNLFPSKLLKAFNGCPILYKRELNYNAASKVEWHLLKSVFNSLHVIPMKSMHNNATDVFLFKTGNIILTELTLLILERKIQTIISFPHLLSEIHWYVPCPKLIVRHGNFYKVFTASVWFVFFITCILSAGITVLIHRSVGCDSLYYRNFSYSCYCIWAVVTSVSVPEMPNTSRLRIFFFMWVCYCLVISTVFQSFFTSFLIDPGQERQISTLEELLSKNLTPFIDFETSMVWFTNLTDGTDLGIKSIERKFNVSMFSIKMFFKIEDSAVAASDLDMKLQMPIFLSGIKPCSFLYSALSSCSAHFLPTSAYHEIFNFQVLKFFEAGLFIKLVDNFTSSNPGSVENVTGIVVDKLIIQKEDGYFIFSTQHLGGVFYIYLCCNFLCFIVFLAEVLSFKIKSL